MDKKNDGSNDVILFFTGLLMTVIGGYMFMKNVQVYSGYIFSLNLMGRELEGVIFIPLIASIIYLFYHYCTASKVCCGLSLAIIIINVIMNMRMSWNSTSLFATVVIFVLLFGGIGLLAKVLFANPSGKHGKKY